MCRYVRVMCVFLLITACSRVERNQYTKFVDPPERIKVQQDSSQIYFIYLPSTYTKEKKYPLVLCFDPHARGDIVVKALSVAAEEMGFIIAGSANAHNNAADISYIIGIFIDDLKKKYSVDERRIYTAGFSGGARIAGSLAFYSGMPVRGVIACGAAPVLLQQKTPNADIWIYSFAGYKDCNYGEIVFAHSLFDTYNVPNYLDAYQGEHAWPSDSLLYDALLYMTLNEMRFSLRPKNTRLITATYKKFNERISRYEKQRDTVAAYAATRKLAAMLSGLKRERLLAKRMDIFNNSAVIRRHNSEEQLYLEKERLLQERYRHAFAEKDRAWWQHEWEVLQKAIRNSNNVYKAFSYTRIKNYIEMLAFVFSSAALEKKENEKFSRYISIYEMINPANPDMFFLKAKFFAGCDREDSAVIYLQKAMDNQFTAMEMLRRDRYLYALYRHIGMDNH